MLIESSKPLKVWLRTGSVELTPGVPTDLPEEEALLLLAKAKGKVRRVETVIEFASPTAKPIYWERGDMSISGPALPLFLERVGNDFVLVIEYRGELVSINGNTLRTRNQFESQVGLREVQSIRECR